MTDSAPPECEGALPDANGIGESGSFSSGPGVRIYLDVGPDRCIRAARFELCRFDDARRVAAMLCRELVGATVDEAERVSAAAVAALAGLTPRDRIARTVHFAKRGALMPFVRAKARAGADVTCTCFGIETETLRRTIRKHRLRTVEEVRKHLPATRGCGTCRPDIEDLLEQAEDQRPPGPGSPRAPEA